MPLKSWQNTWSNLAHRSLSMFWRWLFIAIGFILLFCASLIYAYPIRFSAWEGLSALWIDNAELARISIWQLRLPRNLTAFALGANLAVAGALLQTLLRNPLASPSLLGINAGASLGVVLSTVLFPKAFSAYSLAAIASVFGGLCWLLVMWIGQAWQVQAQKQRLILAGVTLSLMCAGATKLVVIIAEDHAAGVMAWLAGGVAHMRWQEWRILLPFLLLNIVFIAIFSRQFNMLLLSDESAQSLGVNLRQLRYLGYSVAMLLVGSAVSVAGPLAFVGLLVPHLARLLVGFDLRRVLPMCFILGGALVIAADLSARLVAFPREIPAGAILALIGAPIFIGLVRRG